MPWHACDWCRAYVDDHNLRILEWVHATDPRTKKKVSFCKLRHAFFWWAAFWKR
jgi:hypothetical protein